MEWNHQWLCVIELLIGPEAANAPEYASSCNMDTASLSSWFPSGLEWQQWYNPKEEKDQQEWKGKGSVFLSGLEQQELQRGNLWSVIKGYSQIGAKIKRCYRQCKHFAPCPKLTPWRQSHRYQTHLAKPYGIVNRNCGKRVDRSEEKSFILSWTKVLSQIACFLCNINGIEYQQVRAALTKNPRQCWLCSGQSARPLDFSTLPSSGPFKASNNGPSRIRHIASPISARSCKANSMETRLQCGTGRDSVTQSLK